MRSASLEPVVLRGHPESVTDAIRRLAVELRVLENGGMSFHYRLEADMSRVRLRSESPGRGHKLWTRTCFEAFLAQSGASGYYELNFTPSKEWAIYRFSSPREGMAAVEEAHAPEISVELRPAHLALEAQVYWSQSLPGLGSARLRVGLAAVIELDDGSLSYWALKHPPGKPDFHHPDNFALEFAL